MILWFPLAVKRLSPTDAPDTRMQAQTVFWLTSSWMRNREKIFQYAQEQLYFPDASIWILMLMSINPKRNYVVPPLSCARYFSDGGYILTPLPVIWLAVSKLFGNIQKTSVKKQNALFGWVTDSRK